MTARVACRIVLATAAAAALLAGCEAAIVVPSGAVTFSVTNDASGIRVEPDTVHAGTVYLLVDATAGDPVFLEHGPSPCGPLSEAEIDQLRTTGSSQGMCLASGFRAGGQLGNATRLELAPGTYAFTSRAPGPYASPFGPTELAILTVLP